MANKEFHRTNINLYAKDVEYLSTKYGTGWTIVVRDIVSAYIEKQRRPSKIDTKTLTDLLGEQNNVKE